MHQILTWKLTDLETIVLMSEHSLDTVTGCSQFSVFVLMQDRLNFVVSLFGQNLIALYKQMDSLLAGKQLSIDYHQKLQMRKNGQWIWCQLNSPHQIYQYNLDIQQWSVFIKQLELLMIVILENENEKRERGTRCC